MRCVGSLFGEMWPLVLVVDPCALDLFCARGSVPRSPQCSYLSICDNGLFLLVSTVVVSVLLKAMQRHYAAMSLLTRMALAKITGWQ